MATVSVRQTARTYESQKLQEVFRPCEIPTRDDAAAVEPSPASAPVPARTHRFVNELNQLNVGAIVFYLAGLATVILVAMLFF